MLRLRTSPSRSIQISPAAGSEMSVVVGLVVFFWGGDHGYLSKKTAWYARGFMSVSLVLGFRPSLLWPL